MMRAWHAVGLFCDDIREEKRGESLMGIWPDNLNVSTIPGVLPRLGAYVRIHVDPEADIGAISVKIRFPNNEESQLGEFSAERLKQSQAESREKGTPWTGVLFRMIAGNMPIAEPGRLLILVRVGEEEVICGSLNIQRGAKA